MDNSVYPNGLVQVQVKKATGREIPLPYGDPRDIGVVFARMETVFWTGLAVTNGLPQTSKYLTVVAPTGASYFVKATIGTSVRHILDKLELKPESGGKVIMGGRLTGNAIFDLDIPITKEVDGIVLIDPKLVRNFDIEPCFNCGICTRVCPTYLSPGLLSKLCEFDKYEEAEEQNLFHCIECGMCSYVCPSKRPMVHYFRHAKEELLAGRAEQ
jgi:electron transport complex protein RnfC